MKNKEKKKDNSWKILLRAILSGVVISIGGTIFLMLNRTELGAFLFGIGLFMVVVNGYNLYTGKIGYVIDNKLNYLWELFLTLVGNLIGTISCGYLLLVTRYGDKLNEVAKAAADAKLNDNLLSIFVLSIFCGMLMFLAVDLYKRLTDVGRYFAVFLCVTVFIICGFEHCVANMYYFSAANAWDLKTVLYLLVMILGNSVGGILIALGNKYGLKKD
ncbi:MAG: formate/nitrite transporter family protein [Bacilli bacterium]|nr:formate/nitrite transporter family protein [Bacilli bacterium]